MSGENVIKVDEARFLGVLVNKLMNWMAHLKYVSDKVAKFVP